MNDFEQHYNQFLQILELAINHDARQHHAIPRQHAFESIESFFERTFAIAS